MHALSDDDAREPNMSTIIRATSLTKIVQSGDERLTIH
jgi:hypothetical protein